MAALNVPDSRENSLTPPPARESRYGKGRAAQNSPGGIQKNPTQGPQPTNKRTADQAFNDASSEIVSDSQL